MADRWLVTIEAWPHSSGNGHESDQAAAGQRRQDFAIRAVDMADLLELERLRAAAKMIVRDTSAIMNDRNWSGEAVEVASRIFKIASAALTSVEGE